MKARDAGAFDMGRTLSSVADNIFDSRRLTGMAAAFDRQEPRPPRKGPEPKFRNRERELEDVLSALSNDDAEHFWLFVAPPQLGKTWFLRKIGDGVTELYSRSLVHEVDVRELTAEAEDPVTLLARMYNVAGSRPDTHQIATAISGTGSYNLCLLDSAELLSEDTIRGLREALAEVDRLVKDGMGRDVRLALVAASRQDDAWRGVAPLRLSIRPLTEFREDVVFDALSELAAEMHTEHTRSDLRRLAAMVHQLSEGLPALLAGYLAWIRRAKWMELHRLAERDCFDDIATTYITDDLLSSRSLHGRRREPPAELGTTLIEALRVLVPYWFVTGSHLSYYAKEGALRDGLESLGWNEEELWAAVSRIAVLQLPQNELWHAISPPIRRLLFRYWHGSPDSQVRAHQIARDFLESYAQDLTGRERAEIVLECLWHEAESLNISHNPRKAALLTALAWRLSRNLTGTVGAGGGGVMVPSFRERDVRDFVGRRIEDNQELMRALGNQELVVSITAIMTRPDGGGHMS
jgi:hypothetical protein